MMEENYQEQELFCHDELVHDFELAERIFYSGLTMVEMEEHYPEGLYWGDFIL